MAEYGLLKVLNNAQLSATQAEQAAANAPAEAPDPNAGLVDRLAAHIENVWQANRMANEEPHRRMLEDMRQRNGEYDPDKLTAIREQGGSEIFMNVTSVKCRAAESWVRDSMLPQGGERPFSIEPTPIPELPPEVAAEIEQIVQSELMQAIQMGLYPTAEQTRRRMGEMRQRVMTRFREEARRRAKLMEDEIDDRLVEGDFYQVLDELISDFITLPACILKGPQVRKKKRLRWVMDPTTERSRPQVEDELQPYFCRVSPLDLFPSPGARRIGDGPLIEHVRFRRDALYSMIGVPGYNEAKIRAALDEYTDGYLLASINEDERRHVEGNKQHFNEKEKPLSALEFHGWVRGEMLLDWGMDPARVPDKDAEYKVIALKIGRFVVRAVINDDPLGADRYFVESFEKINDSFWGRGVPRLMRDLQAMCNAAARAISNNMGLASGPFMEVEVDRLAPGQEVTGIGPMMIMQTKAAKTTTPSPAVRFHQPNPVADVLLKVYEYFARLADDYTGIPAYSYGSASGSAGAAATASGMSMMLGNAARGIKRAVAKLDRAVEGGVGSLHVWMMMNVQDSSLFGDITIRGRGATTLIAREQMQLRKTEFLKATANPIDAPILGPDGRARLLREVIKDFDIPVDEVIPDRDEVLRRAREAMQMEMMANAGGPNTEGTPENPQALAADGSPAGGLNLMQAA